MSHAPPQTRCRRGQRVETGLSRRSSQFGSRRRRRRAQVGRQVRQGHVGLVSNTADQRNGRSTHRAHQTLVIERPQVLERAAAAAQDQGLDVGMPVRDLDRGAQRHRRIGTLDRTRIDDDADMRCPARQRRQHVVQRRGRSRGDDADRLREGGQRPLGRLIEKPFLVEASAKSKVAFVQGARPASLHRLDDQLQLATRTVDTQPASCVDGLAVGWREVEQARRAAEHRAPQGTLASLSILQREVAVAAGGLREPGDLASDHAGAEARQQRIGCGLQERGDVPDEGPRHIGQGADHAPAQWWRGLRTPQPRRYRNFSIMCHANR